MSDDPVHDLNNMREPFCCKGQAVTTDALNVRKGPSTDMAVVGKLPKGTTVDVWAADGAWRLVQVGTLTGWVSAAWLRVVGELVA